MDEKLGQEPAFPRTAKISENSGKSEYSNMPQKGMSKRFYAACLIAQGIMANQSPEIIRLDADSIAKMAYAHVDELLKQETK